MLVFPGIKLPLPLPLDTNKTFSGTYAPESHPDNVTTVTPTAPPLTFTPPSATTAVVQTLTPFVPTLTPIIPNVSFDTGSATPPMTDGFTVKRDPNDVGGLTVGATVYSDPTEVSSGGAGLPGPVIPTPADVGVAGLPSMLFATEQTSSANGSTAQSTQMPKLSRNGVLIIGALLGLLLLG